MQLNVAIVDYGLGNLLSVRRMLEYCGAKVSLASTPEAILAADRLLLPGVGAFSAGMAELSARGLVQAIREFSKTGRHLLGVCLGMQLLMEMGEENGFCKGLDLLPGSVAHIPKRTPEGKPLKIPHIGWASIEPAPNGAPWSAGILRSITPGDCVYFVHSFQVLPKNAVQQLALVRYHDLPHTAAIESDNLHGCQFHPEKSGPVGVKIIDEFLKLS